MLLKRLRDYLFGSDAQYADEEESDCSTEDGPPTQLPEGPTFRDVNGSVIDSDRYVVDRDMIVDKRRIGQGKPIFLGIFVYFEPGNFFSLRCVHLPDQEV
jgi:hypothetical protein